MAHDHHPGRLRCLNQSGKNLFEVGHQTVDAIGITALAHALPVTSAVVTAHLKAHVHQPHAHSLVSGGVLAKSMMDNHHATIGFFGARPQHQLKHLAAAVVPDFLSNNALSHKYSICA